MATPTPDELPCGFVCTHAITGSTYPAHQAIYICETCRLPPNEGSDGTGAFCICECCAEVCHADHNVEFVGVGPCTCDCFRLSYTSDRVGESTTEFGVSVCKLVDVSREEAIKLGFMEGSRKLNDAIPRKIPPVCTLLPANDEDDDDDRPNYHSLHEEDKLAEWTAPQCIECNSSMGGYVVDSYTIPSLSSNLGLDRCHNLIREAEALIEISRDTFWLPIVDDVEKGPSKGSDLCELELLAKEVYTHHLSVYNLNTTTFTTKHGINKNVHPRNLKENEEASQPGAEWWVQVKPAGSSKAPVDLHYDKDEALAEVFCIGSFPTLSTVTYLTGDISSNKTDKDGGVQKGGMDDAPTVVFPHTYHDEEDQAISSMLLSRPVRGKHIVFDGRLLHGAPGHPALRQVTDTALPESDGSLLRVTFLVNIWRTGRPAGVHILPQAIRNKIQSTDKPQQSLFSSQLEFDKRPIKQYYAPSKLSIAFSAKNPLDTQIILPFVSEGATWINDGETDDVLEDQGKKKTEQNNNLKSDSTSNEEEEPEEEEDELFLSLPQFVTSECISDGSDTSIFLFQIDNEARLVRRGDKRAE